VSDLKEAGWRSLPSELVHHVCEVLELQPRDHPEAALESEYGPVPSVAFVQDVWFILPDLWLRRDRPAREALCVRLAERLEVPPPDDASAQVAFLKAAPHDAALRADVTALLLVRAGAIPTTTSKPPSSEAPESQPPAPLADWYPDPWGQAPLRWWDGTSWTGQVSR
jgi:hypothetical protein